MTLHEDEGKYEDEGNGSSIPTSPPLILFCIRNPITGKGRIEEMPAIIGSRLLLILVMLVCGSRAFQVGSVNAVLWKRTGLRVKFPLPLLNCTAPPGGETKHQRDATGRGIAVAGDEFARWLPDDSPCLTFAGVPPTAPAGCIV